jgi:acetolactate decarboxylase
LLQRIMLAIFLLLPSLFPCGWSEEPAPQTDTQSSTSAINPFGIFQVSTLQALQEGCYDPVITAGELRQRGNFGIGTVANLDGEMMIIDGVVWQILASGEIRQAPDTIGIPFSNISSGILPRLAFVTKTAYKTHSGTLSACADLDDLQNQLAAKIVDRNLPHLITLEGEFLQVQTRSIPAQQKPFPRLADAAKNQVVFRGERVKGVLVGFWFPEYFKGINMSGFHLHFLSDDKKFGGHLLGISSAEGVKYALFPKQDFTFHLPLSADFSAKDISKAKTSELKQLEAK